MKALATISIPLFSILVLSLSCLRETAPLISPLPEKAVQENKIGEQKPSWQREWDKTVAEGRKEGKVVLYGTFGPQTRTAIMEEMKKTYGIEVEALSGRGTELVTKVKGERRSGLYLADLWIGGDTTMVSVLKPEGMLEPLEPQLVIPEVVDATKWYEGQLQWLDKAKYILIFAAGPSGSITINTNMVKPEEIKSYKNLLEPRWKEKVMIFNPVRPGPGNSWFTNMADILGIDYMRALAKQEPVMISDERLQTDWLVRGKYAISIAIGFAQNFQHMAEAGAPVAMHKFAEGEYLTAGDSHIAMFNRAAHPNAARVFVNWLLTPGTQTMMSRENLRQSFRVDVPTDFLPSGHLRESGKKYPLLNEEKTLHKLSVLTPQAQEIFGPLIK